MRHAEEQNRGTIFGHLFRNNCFGFGVFGYKYRTQGGENENEHRTTSILRIWPQLDNLVPMFGDGGSTMGALHLFFFAHVGERQVWQRGQSGFEQLGLAQDLQTTGWTLACICMLFEKCSSHTFSTQQIVQVFMMIVCVRPAQVSQKRKHPGARMRS